ncbi:MULTISPECIES: patatin-like phospholipase family protein [unclassified Duganella]|uniref:patatin-like phospholipase family protein n=1 Tax=unclassified Duganella TaxID=2636909 RepID=UPI00088A25D7|nr:MULTISPECIES: patatin-like phospholipase family protein [unclassified Duganella]SDG96274.1 NTE family protein [Duganella sp. OV458]SDJ46072.1 NTE family protein [Duganella sp. OV510]
MAYIRMLAAALCCGLFISVAQAADQPNAISIAPDATLKPRPKVALVLSGGGARGFAHIGVLRALQELRVPVDFVVGTSMGSVVGGAYAAGSSVDQLEQLVRRTDWNAVVADRPPRDELVYRRREEDLLLPSRIEFGAHTDGVSLPPAAAGNEALELALTRVLPPGARDKPANLLQLPFRSVASDLVTGELVELNDTPLFLAMRASLAVPGVFAPVRINQRLLVDGGLVRNLPVDVAREMGADIIIAVNVGTPLAQEKELVSAVSVAQQMLQILTEQNVQRSLKELRPNDILLQPDLGGIGFLDFGRHERAMKEGEAAVRAMSEKLVKLALPETQYAAYEVKRLSAPVAIDQPVQLTKLEVAPSGRINPKELEVQTGLKIGQMVTSEQATSAGNHLFGRGDLARVETEVRDDENGRSVLIKPTEADWAHSRLRVGIELNSDFSDNSAFQLKAMHVMSSLNDWGGELRSIASVGTDRILGTQFWQPLGVGSQWYAAPSLEYGAGASDIFNSTGFRQARYAYDYTAVTMALGRQLGRWGDLRYTVARQVSNRHLSVPEDATNHRAFQTVQQLSFNVDTLDTIAFPTRGTLVSLNWQRALKRNKSDTSEPVPARQELKGMEAFHVGRWAGHVYGEWARSLGGANDNNLGGFLRLSGTEPNSVVGSRTVLGRVVIARSIGAMPAALGGDVRLGFSLEAGAAYSPSDPLSWGKLKQAGSAFISVDTRFGPLYFGAGATKEGKGSGYLFLGPIW